MTPSSSSKISSAISAFPENRHRSCSDVTVEAVAEVGNPTILATFAVIAAVLPMAFVRGLMGPYMRPIPVGASAAMLFSLMVAFVVSPWAAMRLLGRHLGGAASAGAGARELADAALPQSDDAAHRFGRNRILFFAGVLLLLLRLRRTCSVGPGARQDAALRQQERDSGHRQHAGWHAARADLTRDPGAWRRAGESSPTCSITSSTQALRALITSTGWCATTTCGACPTRPTSRSTCCPPNQRSEQSHAIAKRLRPLLDAIGNQYGARIQVSEVPPGPPVLQTLVAEVYGPDLDGQIRVAQQIKSIFLEHAPGVVDTDWYVEDPQPRLVDPRRCR